MLTSHRLVFFWFETPDLSDVEIWGFCRLHYRLRERDALSSGVEPCAHPRLLLILRGSFFSRGLAPLRSLGRAEANLGSRFSVPVPKLNRSTLTPTKERTLANYRLEAKSRPDGSAENKSGTLR